MSIFFIVILFIIFRAIFRRTARAIWRMKPFRNRAARQEVLHTFYDELSVAKNAPFEVIHAAYKALAQKHHPDKNPTSQDGHERMKAINTAYEVLSDEEKRVQYDQEIIDRAAGKVKEEPPPPSNEPSLFDEIYYQIAGRVRNFIAFFLTAVGVMGLCEGFSELLPFPFGELVGLILMLLGLSFWLPVWGTIRKWSFSALRFFSHLANK